MPQPGTAFIIPADERHGVLGQIIAKRSESLALLVAFLGIHELSSLQQREYFLPLLEQKPLLLASSFDILIENGSWRNLGVFPVAQPNQVVPKFKSGSRVPFLISVESYDGAKCYSTLPFFASHIPRRRDISAKLFENLAVAANGRGTWDKKYDYVLFEGMPVTRQRRTHDVAASRPSGHFVSAKIMDPVFPLKRGNKYEKPLDHALRSRDLGLVTGGGTQMGADNSVAWIALDLELANLEDALEFTRTRLRELGAPPGSLLEYRVDGKQVTLQIS